MLSAFTAGLLLITISELGDKTFFIAAVLAMRHPRRYVFVGAVAALAAMTILSVLLGQALSWLPQIYIHSLAIALFMIFGLKLLYQASRDWIGQVQLAGKPGSQPADCAGLSETGCPDEAQAAIALVKQTEAKRQPKTKLGICLEAFVLTFLAEWGDRTQFATIALATAYPPLGVMLGATLGHAICAAIAVICGRLIAGHISETLMSALGGILFLIFGIVTWLEGV